MKRAAAILAAAWAMVPPTTATENSNREFPARADLKFTGNLRFVTKTFLTVRLDDGRVIDCRLPKSGTLAASAIVEQYKLADEVQIACKRISSELDVSVDRYHLLELTQLGYLRSPTPEEVARVETSLSWQNGENLLKPSPVAPVKHESPNRT